MNRTNIEYLDFTWNPIAMRCTPVSEGCAHCWHLRMCDRMAANPAFSPEVRAAYAGKGPPVLLWKRLVEPLKRRKPGVIGVQFMGDLFHRDVPHRDIYRVFLRMAECHWHTFILLTKRAEHMCMWLLENKPYIAQAYPMDHIWPGVSVENQYRADERIRWLLRTPLKMKTVSVEPMLGSVDPFDVDGHIAVQMEEDNGRESLYPADVIDWIIAGAETGPGARPMDLAWARDLRDQCAAAGVPFFWKRPSPGQETPPDLMVRQWPGEACDAAR